MFSPDGTAPQISRKSYLPFSRSIFNDWSNHSQSDLSWTCPSTLQYAEAARAAPRDGCDDADGCLMGAPSEWAPRASDDGALLNSMN